MPLMTSLMTRSCVGMVYRTLTDKLETAGGRLMEHYQQRCIHELHDYDEQSFPDSVTRPSLLCVSLASVRLLSPTIIEELFFAGLIGSVEIGSIIPYIMRLDAVEYAALLRGGGIAVTSGGASSSSTSPPSFSSYLQLSVPPAASATPATTSDDHILMQRCDDDDSASHDQES